MANPPRRFGAFLRLYGPKGAPTHAKLVIGCEPWPDTPEAFFNEVEEERRVDRVARSHGFNVEYRVHISNQKRPTTSYPSLKRRPRD